MKPILFTCISLCFLLLSCGDNETSNDTKKETVNSQELVGKWQIDVSSFEYELGKGIPADIRKEADKALSDQDFAKDQLKANSIVFEFNKEGKLIIHDNKKKNQETVNWKVVDKLLYFEGELEGQRGKINVELLECNKDKFTIKITGESILAQMKEQRPELLALAKGSPELEDLDKLVSGSWISISFKRLTPEAEEKMKEELAAKNNSSIGNWSEEDLQELRNLLDSERELFEDILGDQTDAYYDCYIEKLQLNYASFEEANEDIKGSADLASSCMMSIFQ